MEMNHEELTALQEEIGENPFQEDEKIEETNMIPNLNTCVHNKTNINSNEDYISHLKKVTSELKCENVVNNMFDFFKKDNGKNFKNKVGKKLFSTSSALPNNNYLHNLTSRLFLDLKEDKEILLSQVLKKLSVLNLIYVRCLENDDLEDAYDLHREWFPVKYLPDFYFSICNFKENTILNEKQIKLQQRIQQSFRKVQNDKCDDSNDNDNEETEITNRNQEEVEKEMETSCNAPKEENIEEEEEKEEKEKEEREVEEGEVEEESNKEPQRVHRKWQEDQIFSVGLFLPYSFIDYINSNAIEELLKKKSLEHITEKEIMLNYIEFTVNEKKENGKENNEAETDPTKSDECEKKKENTKEDKNIHHCKEKKDYLIGSISLLINYDEHTKEKDFSNIYEFYKKKFHNPFGVSNNYLKYVLGSSKQFFENYWPYNVGNKGITKEMNLNENEELQKISNEKNEMVQNVFAETNTNFLDLVILKTNKIKRITHFQKKIYEEIYMNKNMKQVNKKYLKRKITSVYVLTLGTHEYFRGLHLASFLIEFTILYFYFIVYRIFFYNGDVYCYVDNELFLNTMHNMKIEAEDIFEESVISDSGNFEEDWNDSFCHCENKNQLNMETTVNEDKEELKITESNVNKCTMEKQNVDTKILNSKKDECTSIIPDNLEGKIQICFKCGKPQRNKKSIEKNDHVKIVNAEELFGENATTKKTKRKKKNYSICNTIIKHCYKKITASDYLYHLYDVIHKNQWKKGNRNKPYQKDTCTFSIPNYTLLKNPTCRVQLNNKILNLFFHNFEVHNIKNKQFLHSQLRSIMNVTKRKEQGIDIPLYMYLHVIDYNKPATNLYIKLNFYYICTYDNFYDINNTPFSSYLYTYFF